MRATVLATAIDLAESKPVRRKRVLIVGPESWTTEDIIFIKDYLDKRDVSAKTFRVDEGLRLSDVIDALANVEAFVIVLSADRSSWCNRNGEPLLTAAARAGVRCRSMALTSPVNAADTAQDL
jgi:hypothetical protein